MDSSTLFKACVKTVALRNKNLDGEGSTVGPNQQQKRLRRKTAFFTKAQAVVTQISRLRQFLLENRPAYLNFSNYLSTKPNMTDADRDQIDIGAQKIIASCNQLIKELRREIAEADVSQQNLEHRETMLLLIEDYLKRVCNINSEQKAIRVKRAVETRKIAKLESDPLAKVGKHLVKDFNEESLAYERSVVEEHVKKGLSLSLNSSPLKIQELNGDVGRPDEDEISPEDIQIFQLENEQLLSELNTLTEEVKQIESKVVHIAELQEIFTEKVLDQDRDLDRLMTTVVGSTENVKAANEQIRQAIQQNAGLRVWILFFLIVMSFSLLFLDWYNP